MDSSDSSSSNSSAWFSYNYNLQQQSKHTKPQPAFHAALHSVRKPPAKHIITKKPIAPLPPTPPKIYKVEPVEFKDLVQKLTGATTRLQEAAPPPLSLSPPHQKMQALAAESFAPKSFDSASFGGLSPLGFSLSPSSLAWCSTMLLSPGTVASFEPSVVLQR